ncbi:mCG112815, partial [Mus musculus]
GNAIVLISELGLSPREEKRVKSGPPTHGFREPWEVPALGHHRCPDHTLIPPSSCFPM